MKKILLLLILPLCIHAQKNSVKQENLYQLTITDTNHHLATVDIKFTGVVTRTFNVKLPNWRTGKYKILDLASNIRHFQAFDARKTPLRATKINKNTWKIFINTPGVVNVSYQVYANQLHNRVSHIDGTHAFLDASGVFMYSESQRHKALGVQLHVPGTWRSDSGLKRLAKHKFYASNYDQLIDSPIESGIHSYDSFSVDSLQYELIIWGDGNYQSQRLIKDIKKIHHQAKAIWKTFPFKRYVYIFHVGDKLHGATEHVNSTVIHADRFAFDPKEKYNKVIGTTAHEFIHTWNVKSYRPAGITPYDYDKENYSHLFWIAEGSTSYFENILNTRAGIYSLEECFENFAEDIYKYLNKPGKNVTSLAESSFDTWLDNDTSRQHNTMVSIYLKGSLVSWLLDKEVRKYSNNNNSLDDLHQQLYLRYGQSSQAYSSANVLQILQELTQHDFTEFWQKYVDGTEEIDFESLLKFYGLTFEKIKKSENKAQENISLGLNIKDDSRQNIISLVHKNGAAWQAGLAQGDRLVAINTLQVTADNFDSLLQSLKIGESYLVHYFHQGKLMQSTIIPQRVQVIKRKIVKVKNPSKKQRQHFASWLHR